MVLNLCHQVSQRTDCPAFSVLGYLYSYNIYYLPERQEDEF